MKHLLCWVQWHRPVFLGVWETEAGRSQILSGLQSEFNADLNYIMRSRLRNQSKSKQNNTGTLGLFLAYVILMKGPVSVFFKIVIKYLKKTKHNKTKQNKRIFIYQA